MTDIATLIAQLRVLAHLTRAEAQGARLRLPQATDDDVRAVLRRTAADADGRAGRIADVLRDLGALPDPVTPVLGRVAALVRGAVEQAQPLDEALLGDLALEHLLRDRARYVAALADAADRPAVRALADDLAAAHEANARWLDEVLAALAGGRTAALGPSPLQRMAAQVARAANAPGRAGLEEAGAKVRDTVDQAVDTVGHAGGEARAAVEEYAGRAARLGAETVDSAVAASRDAAGTLVGAGRDVLVAGQHTAETTLTTGREAAGNLTRRLTGTADVAGPSAPDVPAGPAAPDVTPIPGFAELSAQAAIAALRTLDDPRDVAAVLAFEQAHGNRPGVVAAARVRAGAVRGG